MLQTFSDALSDHLIGSFPPDKAYGATDFERDEMPPPVAHFLNTALQHGLGIEADALYAARSSWFDYGHPDVQEAFELLIDALRQHAQVPAEAWPETLAQAVEQVTAYLVRPVDTLVEFIFGDKEALRTSTVLSRFEYFAPYAYLHDVTRAYAEEKALDEIERERFRSLLERIDRQMTGDLDATGWLDLLGPLFDLAERAPAPSGVPFGLLQTFFDGKGAAPVQQRLEAEHDAHGTDVLSRTDLHRLLSDVLPPSASRSSAPAAPPEQAAHDQPLPLWMRFQLQAQQARDAAAVPAAAPPRVEQAPPPAAPPDAGSAVPLWMRFQQQSESTSPPPVHAAVPPRFVSGPPPTAALEKRKPPKPEHTPEPPKPTHTPAPKPPRVAAPEPMDELTALERIVLGAFDSEQRERFIEHLFSGSREDYEQTLRQLEAAPTWQRASSIIAQEVFRKHQVNIYSKPAVTFTNAVEARFDEHTFTQDR